MADDPKPSNKLAMKFPMKSCENLLTKQKIDFNWIDLNET